MTLEHTPCDNGWKFGAYGVFVILLIVVLILLTEHRVHGLGALSFLALVLCRRLSWFSRPWRQTVIPSATAPVGQDCVPENAQLKWRNVSCKI